MSQCGLLLIIAHNTEYKNAYYLVRYFNNNHKKQWTMNYNQNRDYKLHVHLTRLARLLEFRTTKSGSF